MNGKETFPLPGVTSDGFSSTTWSLVLAAGRGEDGGNALERLCRKHWRPIYVFARRSGLSPADSEDATQEFFIEFLGRDWLKNVGPSRGRFRAYLLTLLRHFLSNRRRVTRAAKRGGGITFLSLNEADGERELASLAQTIQDPAVAYETAWWNGLLETAWGRLAQEQGEAGKAAQFEALRVFVTQTPAAGDYQRLSIQLGIQRGQVALLVHRLNRRFAELIRVEVAETLEDRSDLEAELRFLREASSR
jgi:DNA-directed RNA polymerase specialized sigma24 family protein